MAIYLKKFETQAAYEAAQSSLILPNVSLTVDNNMVHYNPYVEPIVAKFNVTSTTEPTQIINDTRLTAFTNIEIDDVVQPEVVSAYTFSTTGEHTVKYTLADPTTIYWASFSRCVDMTNIELPNSVTNIGQDAFIYCSGLTSVTMSTGVTSIGTTAFRSCYALTSIDIPNSVTSIGNRAFMYDSGLTSVVIPDGVTSIGGQAFMYCSGLTSITIEATTPPTLGTDVFSDTNDCAIYVPSGSVDTYKAAENWSAYASRIQAMP